MRRKRKTVRVAVVSVRAENQYAALVEYGLLGLSGGGPFIEVEFGEPGGMNLYLKPYRPPMDMGICLALTEDGEETPGVEIHGTDCRISRWIANPSDSFPRCAHADRMPVSPISDFVVG